jgi:hypothetical protein
MKDRKPESKLKPNQTIFESAEMYVNPVYRSTLLYWACYLEEKEFRWRDLKSLLKDLEPLPEYQSKFENYRTAVHVAAMSGNHKKLEVVLKDLNRRYRCQSESQKIASAYTSSDKMQQNPSDSKLAVHHRKYALTALAE